MAIKKLPLPWAEAVQQTWCLALSRHLPAGVEATTWLPHSSHPAPLHRQFVYTTVRLQICNGRPENSKPNERMQVGSQWHTVFFTFEYLGCEWVDWSPQKDKTKRLERFLKNQGRRIKKWRQEKESERLREQLEKGKRVQYQWESMQDYTSNRYTR